jgi:hypothetical protein
MGSSLKLFLAVLIAATIIGCGKMSADSVRDRDGQRVEAAKGMPGNDIPPDPADMAR